MQDNKMKKTPKYSLLFNNIKVRKTKAPPMLKGSDFSQRS